LLIYYADLFKVDPNFLENEEMYNDIKREILGDSDDEESGSGSEYESDEDEEQNAVAPEKTGITDMTETNLINLRRTIYLTIMNSVSALQHKEYFADRCSSTLRKRCTS
jgi:pre-mRNA-splicing factor CWC22